jgi:arylsulfatase
VADTTHPAEPIAPPNVIVVLVDDMGFADLGFMGSEIKTANIDRLASTGLVFTAMYNGARCCPTRAALLTGLYPHNAGVGQMGANLGSPAYQGHLRSDAATIAEVMRLGGYRTLMSGKWHVGGDLWAREVEAWRLGDPDRPTPRQRGFDRFYGIVDGVTNFFSPHCIVEDDRQIEVPATDYYFTDAITDHAIDMIEESVALGQPFFMYLAHAAPHWPLHAHEEDIATYDGVYRDGWDQIRSARHEEMLSRGVLQHRWDLSPRDDAAPAWNDAEHHDWEAQRMAVYAAMIDRLDQSIGRVLATLRAQGIEDDTMILLLSDNGGCAEFMAEDGWAKFMPDVHNDGRRIAMGNRPNLRPGGPLTYMSYDLPWANVSNAPFRRFKHWVHEGGISTPMVLNWPRGLRAPRTVHSPCHVIDVMPTILDACGLRHPGEVGGLPVQSLDGESLMPIVRGAEWTRERPLFWEHEGNAAVRVENLKLVRVFNGPWELYDMEADRTELNNLSEGNSAITERLSRLYDNWAAQVGVRDWNELLPELLRLWQIDDAHG